MTFFLEESGKVDYDGRETYFFVDIGSHQSIQCDKEMRNFSELFSWGELLRLSIAVNK